MLKSLLLVSALLQSGLGGLWYSMCSIICNLVLNVPFFLYTNKKHLYTDENVSKLTRRLGEWEPTPRPTWSPTRMYSLHIA